MAGRRAKRVKATRKVVVGFLGAGVRFSGYLIDISSNGLMVRSSENLRVGDIGRLGIDMGHATIRIVAVVRRVVPGVGVAFEFSTMGPRDREMLQRLLMRLSRQSPT